MASETDDLNEERFRVDRKKLESLLQGEYNGEQSDNNFFLQIEQATNTKIAWPAKLKIGAKSKKDPYIKVAGLPEDREAAKKMVLSVMDTKSTRVTLKMDVSFADHSHIIGKGGNTIRSVMQSTQCHIHFPDSNRTSSEKSNQVSIAGPPFCVESARRQIRELLPIILKFDIPSSCAVAVPDTSSPVITNIAQTFKVTISFQQQLRYGSYIGCVKGLHKDPFAVRDAILKILEHLTGTVPVTVPVTTQIEIDPKHHIFIIGRNGCHLKKITQATGASIHFPNPNDASVRKSTVTIRGTIESAVTAKVYLLQYLPLILMFDVRDGDNDNMLEQGVLNQLMESFDVQISVKPKPRQFCKSIIVKGHEKNAPNIYKTRLHLIGEDPSNMPYLMTPLATLVIPPADPSLQLLSSNNNLQNVSPPNSTTATSHETSPLSPPVQSSSPLERQTPEIVSSANNVSSPFMSVNSVGQRIIGSEMKMKKLSVEALLGRCSPGENSGDSDDQDTKNSLNDGLSNSRSAESILDALMNKSQGTLNKEIESLALSGSWNRPNTEKTNSSSLASTDSGLSHSQEDLNISNSLSMTANLINNLTLQSSAKFNAEDYELRKKMAKNAMQSQVSIGKVRTPTDAWSGLGFSNSMPEAKIKELWNNREKRVNQENKQLHSQNHMQQSSPTTSLDSSVSSSASSASSTHSQGIGNQSPPGNKVVRRPPPGLEDSHPSMSNTLFNNNMDYHSILSPLDPLTSSNFANIKCISDLFAKLNLEQYIEAFEKEEVDLTTFMSLTEEDLKELGVNTFGARKKMSNAMKELQKSQNPSLSSSYGSMNSNNLSNGFYSTNGHHPYSLDVAANSLRW